MSRRPAPILLLEGIAAAAVPTVFLIGHWDATLSAEPEPAANTSGQRGQELADANAAFAPAARRTARRCPAMGSERGWRRTSRPDPVDGIGGWRVRGSCQYLRTESLPGRGQTGPMAAAVEAPTSASDAHLQALAGWRRARPRCATLPIRLPRGTAASRCPPPRATTGRRAVLNALPASPSAAPRVARRGSPAPTRSRNGSSMPC